MLRYFDSSALHLTYSEFAIGRSEVARWGQRHCTIHCTVYIEIICQKYEPCHEEANNVDSNRSNQIRDVQAQKMIRNFGFKKKRDRTILVAKTKALISFAVTFVFV